MQQQQKPPTKLSLIPNINLVFLRGQPPIKRAPTDAVDTCESRPGHFIIIWSVEQGPLGGFLLSPCHCYNKVETGARPLGYSWWQVGPSDSAATYNAPSQSEGPRGEQWGSLRLKKLGCACFPLTKMSCEVFTCRNHNFKCELKSLTHERQHVNENFEWKCAHM